MPKDMEYRACTLCVIGSYGLCTFDCEWLYGRAQTHIHTLTDSHTHMQVLPRDVGAVYVQHSVIKDKYDHVFHYLIVANQFKDGILKQPEISVYRWDQDAGRFFHDHVIRCVGLVTAAVGCKY